MYIYVYVYMYLNETYISQQQSPVCINVRIVQRNSSQVRIPPQKSPMYILERPLCIDIRIQYICAKHSYIHLQKRLICHESLSAIHPKSAFLCKRTLCISIKKHYIPKEPYLH